MNRLQHETSPYLLQHAHNPVDWYAWKSEAFEKAQKENKPIIVSIGYSTCHWCHVMERESFESEEIAAFMNKHFVNIKVDREERPDVDQIYMEACQAISGSGGWPLNCFLTPDGRPFFAGTYYPPKSAYNRPSWPQVLENIVDAFQNKQEVVQEQANRLTEIIKNSDSVFIADKLLSSDESSFNKVILENIFLTLKKRFDHQNGGFGGAPKFPGTMSLQYLLEYYFYHKQNEALEHVLFSLDKMIRGGIYDQLGGGFARYATDKAWLIPHFEKMLYDNALLVSLIASAYQLTGKKLYKDTIEETLAFIEREMTHEQGGFYAALDADSEGEEGKFYVWDSAEIKNILGKEADLFCTFYDISESGNWEGKNIMWRQNSLEDFAAKNQLNVVELTDLFYKNKKQLFQYRSKRIRPGLDDKILLDWNALQCSAYAKAYEALNQEKYKSAAIKNLQFIFDHMILQDGITLYHTYKNGIGQYEAFLNDYAFLIEALLDVYHITFDLNWLTKAERYTEFVIDHFFDQESQLFFFTSAQQTDLILRRKELYDSALPSGNSTMVRNLQRLGILLDRATYKDKSSTMLRKLKDTIEKYPSSFSRWGSVMLSQIHPHFEIAIVGKKAKQMAQAINEQYLPNKLMMATEQEQNQYPLLSGKMPTNDTLIYVCQNYACQLPVTSLEAFEKLISP